MEDGSKRIVDLLVRFKKAEPAIYVEKWDGQLAVEINDTHPVDSKKELLVLSLPLTNGE